MGSLSGNREIAMKTKEQIIEILKEEIYIESYHEIPDSIGLVKGCFDKAAARLSEGQETSTLTGQAGEEPIEKSLRLVKKYLAETPKEKIQSIIDEINKLDISGPTIEEYFQPHPQPEITDSRIEECEHQWQEVWKDNNFQSSWGANRCMKCEKIDEWQYDYK
jgi:hypothetical protein